MKKSILVLAVSLFSVSAHAACSAVEVQQLRKDRLQISGKLLEAADKKDDAAMKKYGDESIKLMQKAQSCH